MFGKVLITTKEEFWGKNLEIKEKKEMYLSDAVRLN